MSSRPQHGFDQAEMQGLIRAVKISRQETADVQSLLDQHAIISVTDECGRIIFANGRFCEVSGYSCEELLGQDQPLLNSGHHSEAFFQELWQTVLAGKTWRGEICHRTKAGKLCWLATTIVPQRDSNGNIRQLVALHTDVSQQKRVEQELAGKLRLQHLLSELLSHFVAAPSAGIDLAVEEAQRAIVETLELDRSTLWQIEHDHSEMVLTHCWQIPERPPAPTRFSVANNLPWTCAKIVGGHDFHFTSIDELPSAAAKDIETLDAHGLKSSAVFPLVAGDRVFGALTFDTLREEHVWKEDELANLKLLAQVVGNVLIRKQAEERAELIRAEATHASRFLMMGELSAALAHELSQPLTSILSNAQAAIRFMDAQMISSQEHRQILEDIVRDNKRAGAVIQNLRSMLRKESPAREICCANELIREMLDFMKSELASRQVSVSVSLQENLPNVRVARVEIQQVLVNLLLNAAHAVEAAPLERHRVFITSSLKEQQVLVTVRDHGCGIPPERAAVVFSPFYSTKGAGLGMGLTICRRIIAAHRGTIQLQSEQPGASITFSLPVEPVSRL